MTRGGIIPEFLSKPKKGPMCKLHQIAASSNLTFSYLFLYVLKPSTLTDKNGWDGHGWFPSSTVHLPPKNDCPARPASVCTIGTRCPGSRLSRPVQVALSGVFSDLGAGAHSEQRAARRSTAGRKPKARKWDGKKQVHGLEESPHGTLVFGTSS